MISRRLLRVKAMQILYAYFKNDDQHSLNNTEKELFFSLQKTYDLYHYLIYLIIDIQDLARNKIELARQKHIASWEDIHPNLRFSQNRFIAQLRENSQLSVYITKQKLSWNDHPDLIRELFTQISESEEYRHYMENPVNTWQEDREIVCQIFEKIIAVSDNLAQTLEEQCIYWNDDIEFVISMILKTFERFKLYSDRDAQLMPMFQKEDDREFVKILVRKTILNHKEYRDLVIKFAQNWDVERIAFMDIISLTMAIAEIIEFQTIPIKVTLNEFIEISKYYSTEKSSTFINGILDKIVEHLQKEGKITKAGRGE